MAQASPDVSRPAARHSAPALPNPHAVMAGLDPAIHAEPLAR
ncbi:hypothetical protein [Xanthobacter versatilis]